jgi:hypothetical protein
MNVNDIPSRGFLRRSSLGESQRDSDRSADFPVRSNPRRFYGAEQFCNAGSFHVAADWKVRAPISPDFQIAFIPRFCFDKRDYSA